MLSCNYLLFSDAYVTSKIIYKRKIQIDKTQLLDETIVLLKNLKGTVSYANDEMQTIVVLNGYSTTKLNNSYYKITSNKQCILQNHPKKIVADCVVEVQQSLVGTTLFTFLRTLRVHPS